MKHWLKETTFQAASIFLKVCKLHYGAPGEIRTPDRLVRSQVLYPAELRVRECGPSYSIKIA